MPGILPRPNVEVAVDEITGKSHVVISREGKGRIYEVEGNSEKEKIKGVVEKVINDRYTGEWLP